MSTNPSEGARRDATPAPLIIDVISDVVCPWCFIGKRQLEQALERWREAHPAAPQPVVNWHAFQLNPDMPIEGMARADYLQRKFGHSDGGRIYANVRRAAQEVGLDLKLDRIQRQPSTLRPHALLLQAAEQGVQDQLAEALFIAYFMDGRDLSDVSVLQQIAESAGLQADRITRALEDPEQHTQIAEADMQARDNGISGVPFFIIDQKLAVSGAAGADHLLAAIQQATGDTRPTV